jgi:ribosomal protein S6--L-glutamate ligase
VVMEVNSSPGLEGIENATQRDIAGMIIEFLVRDAASGPAGSRTRTRGQG